MTAGCFEPFEQIDVWIVVFLKHKFKENPIFWTKESYDGANMLQL